jgi:hypothetical protein
MPRARRAGVLLLQRRAVCWARRPPHLAPRCPSHTPKHTPNPAPNPAPQEYAKAFLAAGFSENQNLYIASGLLSYDSSREMLDMLEFLRPFSKTVQYKERYIPAAELHALNPEQQVGAARASPPPPPCCCCCCCCWSWPSPTPPARLLAACLAWLMWAAVGGVSRHACSLHPLACCGRWA